MEQAGEIGGKLCAGDGLSFSRFLLCAVGISIGQTCHFESRGLVRKP